jgi:hypothetical protein
MGERTDLHVLLVATLGTNRVYFQAPSSVNLVYPCIIYERARLEMDSANNKPYILRKKYKVTVIYKNPDSAVPVRLAMLPNCTHDRQYKADGLYHDVFVLYY